MAQNTQEYINRLINKSRMFYLDLSNTNKTSACSHCNKKNWEEKTCNLSGEIEDLNEFQCLKGINTSNNQFTNLDALLTLPNKDKVEKINFFGNKIGEVDLARIFTDFPNLKYLNLDYNPLRVKNLSNLTSQQLEKLVEGMKNKKIRISASKGTVLADLLEYTQGLIKNGNGSQQQQAYQLQAILQSSPVNSEKGTKGPSYTPWIIGGVAVVSLALIIGYLLGKRRKEH